jgi:hypothetical protein
MINKEQFKTFHTIKQQNLKNNAHLVIAKLKADNVDLKNLDACRNHLLKHTVGREYCVMIFNSILAGAFKN